MPRHVLLASAGAVALAGAAFAAEPLPPPPPPPPVFTWTGVYIGINAGAHWGGQNIYFDATDTSSLAVGGGIGVTEGLGLRPEVGTHGASGFIGGGQIGYNYQINSIVLGIEADIDGATGTLGQTFVGSNAAIGFPEALITTSSQQLDWLGTLRGRLGWTPLERAMIYVTGGLAFGQSTASFADINGVAIPPLFDFASSSRHVGWTAGGGVEYALPGPWSNWSLKVEYLYYDLGISSATVFYQNIDLTGAHEFSSITGRMRQNGNIARAGLNYKFNWLAPAPVIAKY
jgi:outer membrane immunogenic protein